MVAVVKGVALLLAGGDVEGGVICSEEGLVSPPMGHGFGMDDTVR